MTIRKPIWSWSIMWIYYDFFFPLVNCYITMVLMVASYGDEAHPCPDAPSSGHPGFSHSSGTCHPEGINSASEKRRSCWTKAETEIRKICRLERSQVNQYHINIRPICYLICIYIHISELYFTVYMYICGPSIVWTIQLGINHMHHIVEDNITWWYNVSTIYNYTNMLIIENPV